MTSIACARIFKKAFLKKPIAVCLAEEKDEKLERNLSLTDLLAIGIGGTVGSGVFVLTGLIARDYAGPGVVWSWLIAGFGCFFGEVVQAQPFDLGDGLFLAWVELLDFGGNR